MASDGEGTESTKEATIAESDEGGGNEDQQDGFLVNVPAEEERGVGTESGGANEGGPGGVEKEADEGDDLEEEGEGEGGGGRDGGKHGEGGVAYEAAGYALEGGGVDGEADVWGDFEGLVTKHE